MKYSEILISDDNEDNEMEKLANQNEYSYGQYLGFHDNIDAKFSVQQSEFGYDEWVYVGAFPNHSIDCIAPIIESIVAYEFGNGFMLFGERDSIYD